MAQSLFALRVASCPHPFWSLTRPANHGGIFGYGIKIRSSGWRLLKADKPSLLDAPRGFEPR